MTLKKFILIFALFIGITGMLKAQNQYGTWTSVGLEKKTGNWNFGAETEVRTIHYVRLINRWSLGLNADYKIAKPLKVGLGYEFMNVLDEKYLNYQFRNRFNADITGKQKLGNISFSLRERIQLTKKNDSKRIDMDGLIDSYNIDPAWVWRNKLDADYNIPKCRFTPGISIETFYSLNDPDGNKLDKLRYILYTDYKINKHNKIKVFGVLNSEKGTDEADYSGKYNLGLSYTHELK